MIENFEHDYMIKYWNIQLLQWCNYFEHGNDNLSLADKEIFDIVNKYYGLIEPIDRKSEIACLLMKKDLVDKNPIVSKIRNNIDNLDNDNNLYDLDKKSYLAELSLRLKNDVLTLINLRNNLSRELGFSSYPELVLKTEEIDKDTLIKLLNKYVEENLPKVKELIELYNIRWESWFSDLNRISKIEGNFNYIEIINQFLNKLGFEDLLEKIQIKFMEHKITGIASEVNPNDIRVVVTPLNSLFDVTGLFHELGHSISYYFNKEIGLYKILTASYDEAMAVVIELIAPKIIFDESLQKKLADIQVLEYTRCAISSLFEFELWENPENAENLYIKYYSQLGFKINNPTIWASDSFRSIDPVYIHNYVIGAILVKQLNEYLLQNYSCNYMEWGKWLVNNIYIDGRRRSFKEKLEIIKYFK